MTQQLQRNQFLLYSRSINHAYIDIDRHWHRYSKKKSSTSQAKTAYGNYNILSETNKLIRFLSIITLLVFGIKTAWGQNYNFKYTNSGGTTNSTDSFYEACTQAAHGTTIKVNRNATINASVSINKTLTIEPANSADCWTLTNNGSQITIGTYGNLTIKNLIFDGNNIPTIYQLFYCSGKLTMQGTDSNGNSVASRCKIINCIKNHSEEASGAAILVTGKYGKLTCTGVTFENNTNRSYYWKAYPNDYDFVFGGGAIALTEEAVFNLTQCKFYGNTACEAGGAIYLYKAGSGEIKDCVFGSRENPNRAFVMGGAIYGNITAGHTLSILGETKILYNEVVEDNYLTNPPYTDYRKRDGFGGGMFFVADQGDIVIGDNESSSKKVQISHNKAYYGGGGGITLLCDADGTHQSNFTLQNFIMEGNYAGSGSIVPDVFGGGAFYVIGSESKLHDAEHMIIKNGSIKNNISYDNGGGMCFAGHDCHITNVTFENNFTHGSNSKGGAVMVLGKDSNYTLHHKNKFENCKFHNNGLSNAYDLYINDEYSYSNYTPGGYSYSTITYNSTTAKGGAVYGSGKTELDFTTCAVGVSAIGGSGENSDMPNKADEGGGIYVDGLAMGKLIDTEVKYNVATTNGGGVYSAGNFIVDNSTVSENTATDGQGGGIYSINSPGQHIVGYRGIINASYYQYQYLNYNNTKYQILNDSDEPISDQYSLTTSVNAYTLPLDAGTYKIKVTNLPTSSYYNYTIQYSLQFHLVLPSTMGTATAGSDFSSSFSSNEYSFRRTFYTNNLPANYECIVCTFTVNDASSDGALDIRNNSHVNHNTAKTDGGGIYMKQNSFLGVFSSEVNDNTATTGNGGGIYLGNSVEAFIEDNATVNKNEAKAGNGGGLYLDANSEATINGTGSDGVLIQNNKAKIHGGGVYKLGSLKVQGLIKITDNTAGNE